MPQRGPPALDGDAVAADVRTGKTFHSNDPMVKLTGNIAEVAIAAGSENVPAGIHTNTTLSTIDPDLTAAKMKAGEVIFGITGTAPGAYQIGDTKLYGSVTTVTRDNEAYGLMKDITIGDQVTNLTVRTAFALSRTGSPGTVYGKVYKDGTPVGTERSNNSATKVWYTEDLAFNDGEGYEIWGKTGQASIGNPVKVWDNEIRWYNHLAGWAIIVE